MTSPAASVPSGPAPTRAVVVGGSAGSVEILPRLLASLPEGFTLPVVVLIHIQRNRKSSLAGLLGPSWTGPVREPEDKEPLSSRTLYVAPPDYHLLVDPGPAFALSVEAPVNFSIPSIDLLFGSAAGVFGPGLAAVLLSGASADGAHGLREVDEAGGLALVQDPGEAACRTMPEAGRAICPQAQVLRVREISEWLIRFASWSSPAPRGAP